MGDYRRLNLSTISFSSETITYDDATKNALHINNIQKENIKVLKAEKDYTNKCVKLEIS